MHEASQPYNASGQRIATPCKRGTKKNKDPLFSWGSGDHPRNVDRHPSQVCARVYCTRTCKYSCTYKCLGGNLKNYVILLQWLLSARFLGPFQIKPNRVSTTSQD